MWLFDPLIDKMKKSSLGLRGLSAYYTCMTYKQHYMYIGINSWSLYCLMSSKIYELNLSEQNNLRV